MEANNFSDEDLKKAGIDKFLEQKRELINKEKENVGSTEKA